MDLPSLRLRAMSGTFGFYLVATLGSFFGVVPWEICLHSIVVSSALMVGYRQTKGQM